MPLPMGTQLAAEELVQHVAANRCSRRQRPNSVPEDYRVLSWQQLYLEAREALYTSGLSSRLVAGSGRLRAY
jgi:hypothetical protein